MNTTHSSNKDLWPIVSGVLFIAVLLLAFLVLREPGEQAPPPANNPGQGADNPVQNPPPAAQQPAELPNLIRVSLPLPDTTIQSPTTIRGEARGTWFFEGSFPIKLVDGTGKQIATGIAQAQGEWMTENYVPFTAQLVFTAPATTTRATLILQKDNPSGLPQNDNELWIPVTLAGKQ